MTDETRRRRRPRQPVRRLQQSLRASLNRSSPPGPTGGPAARKRSRRPRSPIPDDSSPSGPALGRQCPSFRRPVGAVFFLAPPAPALGETARGRAPLSALPTRSTRSPRRPAGLRLPADPARRRAAHRVVMTGASPARCCSSPAWSTTPRRAPSASPGTGPCAPPTSRSSPPTPARRRRAGPRRHRPRARAAGTLRAAPALGADCRSGSTCQSPGWSCTGCSTGSEAPRALENLRARRILRQPKNFAGPRKTMRVKK